MRWKPRARPLSRQGDGAIIQPQGRVEALTSRRWARSGTEFPLSWPGTLFHLNCSLKIQVIGPICKCSHSLPKAQALVVFEIPPGDSELGQVCNLRCLRTSLGFGIRGPGKTCILPLPGCHALGKLYQRASSSSSSASTFC